MAHAKTRGAARAYSPVGVRIALLFFPTLRVAASCPEPSSRCCAAAKVKGAVEAEEDDEEDDDDDADEDA